MPGPIRPEEIRQIGRYPVRRFVAEGGMSWVFEVEDPELYNARRAIKLLKPEAAVGAELERFESEVRTLAGIQHPNLMRVTAAMDFDEATGCHYYAMDFIEGGTLAGVHVTGAPDPEATFAGSPTHTVEKVCEYFEGILAGLARLHAHGIIHRDIKPANLFLTREGIPILADLGIAKYVGTAGVTQQGAVPITPLYASPEHAVGEEVGPESDLFSIGLSLYRVLTGKSVYDEADGVDSSNSQAVMRHLWTLQGAAREFDFGFEPQIPAPIQEVIRRACRMQPTQRYRSADDMRGALREATQQGETLHDRGPGVAKPRPWRWVVFASVLLALGGGWFGFRMYQDGLIKAESERLKISAEAAGSELEDLLSWLSEREAKLAGRLAKEAKPERDQAAIDLEIGSVYFSEGNYAVASGRFERAHNRYAVICDLVLEQHLGQDAGARKRKALAQLESLPDDIPDLSAQIRERLRAVRAGLEDPVGMSGCELTAALRRQVEATAGVEGLVTEVRASAGAGLVESAKRQLREAEEQKLEAQAAAVTDERYTSRMDSAERSLRLASSALRKAGNGENVDASQEALDHASSARAGFLEAGQVGLALRSARDAEELASEAELHFGIGYLRLELRDASSALEDEAWVAARDAYEEVREDIARELEAARGAISESQRAEESRKSAASEGVPATELAEGNRLIADAQIKLQARKFPEAEDLFKRAWDLNAAAIVDFKEREGGLKAIRRRVREELDLARAAEKGATREGSSSGGARTKLKDGRNQLAEAQAENAAGRPTEAFRLAQDATSSFQTAAKLEQADQARTRAGRLISDARKRNVQSAEWESAKGKAERSFEDERWEDARVDYESLAGQLERLIARKKRGAIETARLAAEKEKRAKELEREEDKKKKRASNRPPRLTRLHPNSTTLSVRTDEGVRFEVSVVDPDGDGTPEVSWYLDGLKNSDGSEGPRYTLPGSSAGRHQVHAIARDAHGAESERVEWTVEVVGGDPESPTLIVDRWCAAFAEEDMTTLDAIMVWEGDARKKTLNAFKKYDFRQTCEIEETKLRGAFSTLIVLVHRQTIDNFRTMEAEIRYKFIITGSDSARKIEAIAKVL